MKLTLKGVKNKDATPLFQKPEFVETTEQEIEVKLKIRIRGPKELSAAQLVVPLQETIKNIPHVVDVKQHSWTRR